MNAWPFMRPSFISRTSNLQKTTKRTIQLIFLSTQNKKENQLQPLNRLEDETFSLGSIPVFLNLEQRVIRNYSLLKRSSCQVLSQSKARVEPVETSRFPALDVSCKYFLGVMLCSIHCLRQTDWSNLFFDPFGFSRNSPSQIEKLLSKTFPYLSFSSSML